MAAAAASSPPSPPPDRHEETDPLFLSLRVPYICGYSSSETRLQFFDIPSRHGIDWHPASDSGATSLNAEDAAIFLQEWLFFASLNSVCNLFEVQFDPTDFVSVTSEHALVVTGVHFHKYICFWTGGLEMGLRPSTVARLHEQRRGFTSVLDAIETATRAWVRRERSDGSANLSLVLLSIALLADHLGNVFKNLFHSQTKDGKVVNVLNTYPSCGRELLLKAGWCVGELPGLLSRYTPSTLLYLSTLTRKRQHKDHSRCLDDSCQANQLDQEHYQSLHTRNCSQSRSCEMVYAPVEQICNILEAGHIPLLRLCEDNHVDAPRLSVETFYIGDNRDRGIALEQVRYVGVSHVWSDGMGNPHRNALHECQLRRIQHAVNDLYIDQPGPATKNRLFWMDTLCVPLNPKIRSLAIIRMARTFLHADKVLVMDNWMMEDSVARAGPKNILWKIVHSDWNARIWTFHEAVLARQCYIQLADAAVTLESLSAANSGRSLTDVISCVFSNIAETKLLNTNCTLNLLRALVHIDPSAIDRSDRVIATAAMPPQDDPSQELDRLTAIQTEHVFKRQCRILERWFSVLERADCISEDPEADEHRLRTLIEPFDLDPVAAHVSVLVALIRGFGFDFIMDRSDDLQQRGNQTRQLRGFRSQPSSLLPEMAAAVRGRTTSWTEDETICLGGIIGLDVSPIVSVRVDPKKRDERAEQEVCEQRMKIFLSQIKDLPEAILFWPSKRMTIYPWRWAPVSFLANDERIWMLEQIWAECTDSGLLVQCPGITISPSKQRLRTGSNAAFVRLRYRIPHGISTGRRRRPAREPTVNTDASDITIAVGSSTTSMATSIYEMLLELYIPESRQTPQQAQQNHPLCSWPNLLDEHSRDELVVLHSSNPNRAARSDAVVVRALGLEKETGGGQGNSARLVSYVTNVRLVSRTAAAVVAQHNSDLLCMEGEMAPRGTMWCVG